MPSFKDASFLINQYVIIIRFGGEIGIKSRRTRNRMLSNLKNDIENCLEKYPSSQVINFWDRLLIFDIPKENIDKIAVLISNSISGISSTSTALVVRSTEEEIISAALNEANKIFQPYSSFRVSTRREGNHPFSSMEISSKLGAVILSKGKNGLKVNLRNPDFQIYLDIRGPLTFIYTAIHKGFDGIPSKSQGTAVALMKPNLNSIQSAWLMKKRGVKVIPIFFKTGKSSEENFLKQIQSYFSLPLKIISLKPLLTLYSNSSSLCVFCQLFCEQQCQKLAEEANIPFIISPTCFNYNGENMSLDALKMLETYSKFSIIRPIQFGFHGYQLSEFNCDKSSCCAFRSKVTLEMHEDCNKDNLDAILEFKLNFLD